MTSCFVQNFQLYTLEMDSFLPKTVKKTKKQKQKESWKEQKDNLRIWLIIQQLWYLFRGNSNFVVAVIKLRVK